MFDAKIFRLFTNYHKCPICNVDIYPKDVLQLDLNVAYWMYQQIKDSYLEQHDVHNQLLTLNVHGQWSLLTPLQFRMNGHHHQKNQNNQNQKSGSSSSSSSTSSSTSSSSSSSDIVMIEPGRRFIHNSSSRYVLKSTSTITAKAENLPVTKCIRH